MQRHRLLTIFAVVFVNMLGFGLILPLLPFYAETFNASGTVVGLLVASYAATQMIGAPVLGRISDRVGRRPILLVSLVGSFLGFVRAISPAIGGALFDLVGVWAPGMFAAALMSWLVWQMWRRSVCTISRSLAGLEHGESPR